MTNNKVGFALAFLLSFSLVNCKKGTNKPEERKSSLKTGAKNKPVKRDVPIDMKKEHFRLANKVLDAVIEGDLKKARLAGEWLASADRIKELPKGWAAHWSELQGSGKALAKAASQQDAALIVSKIARVCGNCHIAMKAKIKPSEKPLKTGMGGTKAYMLRHIWATARFWEGLSLPSDAAWVKGSDALTQDKYLYKKIYAKGKLQKELQSWAKFIVKMGERAKTTKTPAERSKLFGGLLQGCFHCHQRMIVDLKQFPH